MGNSSSQAGPVVIDTRPNEPTSTSKSPNTRPKKKVSLQKANSAKLLTDSSERSRKSTTSSYSTTESDWPYIWAIRTGKYLDWTLYVKSREEAFRITLQQTNLPVCIIPNKLYIGDAKSIQDFDKLQTMGITHILNMGGPHACPPKVRKQYPKHKIVYHQINAKDIWSYPLLDNHWDEAYEFLQSSLDEKNQKVVVNCMMGQNRSALIVCAYYMIATQTNVLATVQHLRRQRGNSALENQGFQEQLVALARQHNLLGPAPGTLGCVVPFPAPEPPTKN